MTELLEMTVNVKGLIILVQLKWSFMPVENFHGQGYKCLRGNSADTKDILQMLVLLGQNSIRLCDKVCIPTYYFY